MAGIGSKEAATACCNDVDECALYIHTVNTISSDVIHTHCIGVVHCRTVEADRLLFVLVLKFFDKLLDALLVLPVLVSQG